LQARNFPPLRGFSWRNGRASGRKVTSRKQAIAIGLSEARREGAKVPKKASSRSSSKKSASKTRKSAKKSAKKRTSKKAGL